VDFVGCGCVFNKAVFAVTSGFVPLPVAYGMEEIDLSLRLTEMGLMIIKSPLIHVFHDTDERHHMSPEINGGALANVALHAYLRYPIIYMPLGFAQYLNRVIWSLIKGRPMGLMRGLAMTIPHLLAHRHLRSPVSCESMQRYRSLKQGDNLRERSMLARKQ
jgi:hypothetical protein